MKNSKKILSALLAVSMLATFAACGKDEPTNNGSGSASGNEGGDLSGKTITFTMQKYGNDASAQEKVLKEMTEAFKEETGITVKYSIIDWGQALTKLTLACTGGEAPDVADVFFTPSMVKIGNGQYGPADITNIYEELGGDDAYFEAVIDEVKIDGKVYGIPWRMDTRAMVYNKAHFEEAGITEVPTTYDELIEAAKKLTKTDGNGNITRSGAVLPVGQARFDQGWFNLLAGHGTSVMNEDYTEFTFGGQEGIDTIQFMLDLINKHKVCTPNVIDPSFDSNTEFQAEKASIVLGANADFMTAVQANAPQLEEVTCSAVMPNLTGEGVSSVAYTAPISIMNSTKERAAAEEWLKYFCSKDGQIKFCSAVNLINARKEVMEDEFYQSDWMKAYPEQANRAIYGDPAIPTWSQIDAFPNGPLNTMLTNIVGGADIQTEVDNCLKQCQEIYDKGEVDLG
ncbi:ABC transporter substrate-binding protein [Massiliimalia timonensis]|uniref:ABC transporter substrate-binding protein n=1 Tax=Massiliimalia timonensis TaxID=1987501 RepID=UPI00189EDB2E|nr:extracellular solute-binding protein [Massiliimalia timonensis]